MRWSLALAALPLLAQNPASVWITASDSRIIAGSSVQLTALARDSAGRALPNQPCSFTLFGPGPFTVTSSGMVPAVNPGIGDISATCATARHTIRLQSLPSAFTLTAADKQINGGESVSYSAAALDVTGNPIPNTPLTWN